MAINTGDSRGAGPRLPALGLAQVDIEVPAVDDLTALADRVTHVGIQTRNNGQTVSFNDPWANAIRLGVAST